MAAEDAIPWIVRGDFSSPPAATAARLGAVRVRASVIALPSTDGTCWATKGTVSNQDYFVAQEQLTAACARPTGLVTIPLAPRSPVWLRVVGATEPVEVLAFKPPMPITQRAFGPLTPEPSLELAQRQACDFSAQFDAAVAAGGAPTCQVGEWMQVSKRSFDNVDCVTQGLVWPA